jgi:cytochrome b561
MTIKNTENRYGLIMVLFHWLMALLIIGLLILGIYMVRVPISVWKLKLFGWHKDFGVLALMLVAGRLAWRLGDVLPTLDQLAPWERLAAHAMHWTLYTFMVLLPLSGWLLTSAAGLPVSFFGLFVLPDLVGPNEELRLFFTDVHQWLAYILIVLICGHMGAALKHHFINKDDILRRIL